MSTAKIIVQDEVNIKITGLDLSDRKALMRKFEFEKPGARFLPSVRLGRWNGKISYFSLGGSTYLNLLPEILPYIDQQGYDIELEDLRTPRAPFVFQPADENLFSSYVWPKGHTQQGQPVILRDYQLKVINDFLSAPQSIQEVATGSGKTITTAALSYSVQEYGRSIIIVPNKSLVVQTEEDYRNVGLDVGVYFGDKKELGKRHTICTWQSLGNLIKGASDSDDSKDILSTILDELVCIIVDECFHGDTKVLTPLGYVPIKELKPGDKVINFSEKTKIFKEDTVVKKHTNLLKSNSEKMYELTFDTGERIKVTGNHMFLTKSGWTRADQLTEDHEIITPNINTRS